ncbi:hypothetical protein [Methanothrix sp.]|uniref:hypothetical protein n=1 Tax=Methanothrix sp. TaxID=90426 RepID=UPI003BB57754
MSEQMISCPEKEDENGRGLTTEQRRHLEKSLKENDELMKPSCLARHPEGMKMVRGLRACVKH